MFSLQNTNAFIFQYSNIRLLMQFKKKKKKQKKKKTKKKKKKKTTTTIKETTTTKQQQQTNETTNKQKTDMQIDDAKNSLINDFILTRLSSYRQRWPKNTSFPYVEL